MIGSVIGSVGSFAQGQAQANAQNAAAIQNYEYQIAQRENKWRQTLSAWGHKRLEYKQTIQENEAAAWAGYTQEQTRLNEVYKDVKFKNQDALIQLIDAQGKMAASGQSGNTARRMQVAAMAAYGRNQAINAESLISARNRMVNSTENIRRQQMSANNRAYSQVALRPIAGFAPPPPVMTPGPSPLGLVGGILNGVAGGIGEMNSLQAPQGFVGGGGQAANMSMAPANPYSGGFNFSSGYNFSSPIPYTAPTPALGYNPMMSWS
nr:hypothetical protein 29 [bacterium]